MTTLLDFANNRQNVVLFWAGVGSPGGSYTLVGHPDFDFAERFYLANGSVDGDEWRWDGTGELPNDDNANTVYKLHAYVDREKWNELSGDCD